MILQIKQGPDGAAIDFRHFRPHMARGIEEVLIRAPRMEDNTLTITCGADSHIRGLHPEGRAIDFRGNSIIAPLGLVEQREIGHRWAATCQWLMGGHYDFEYETFDLVPERDHLHMEYDFKTTGKWPSEGFYQRVALLRSA